MILFVHAPTSAPVYALASESTTNQQINQLDTQQSPANEPASQQLINQSIINPLSTLPANRSTFGKRITSPGEFINSEASSWISGVHVEMQAYVRTPPICRWIVYAHELQPQMYQQNAREHSNASAQSKSDIDIRMYTRWHQLITEQDRLLSPDKYTHYRSTCAHHRRRIVFFC